MRSTYDVCIVGGGIIGVSIAYYLAKKGLTPLVVDRGSLGNESTLAGAGVLGAQVEAHKQGPLFDFGIASRKLFPKLGEELKDLSGVDIELKTSGVLRLAMSLSDRRSLLARYQWQTASGEKAEWLEEEDLRKDFGSIFGPFCGALFLPDDHQVRNRALLLAYIGAAAKLGATFLEHTEVRSFFKRGMHISGIVTDDGTYEADSVVLAAGAWSGALAKTLGLELPVFPVKGHSVLTDANSPATPFTIYTDSISIVPKSNGQIYIGGTQEMAGFNKTATLGGVSKLLSDAVHILPSLQALGINSQLAGLRPGTQDGLPFLGEVPGLLGLYLAAGHHRNGVLLAPLTGEIMADLIAGSVPAHDIRAFHYGRLFKDAVPKTMDPTISAVSRR